MLKFCIDIVCGEKNPNDAGDPVMFSLVANNDFFFYSSRKMLQNLAQIFKHFFELQVQYFHLKLN